MAKDYYKTLGVSKTATKEEISKAYKNLAKKYHPDINGSPEATEKFKEINAAYDILGNEQKRSSYDSFGSEDGSQGFGGFGQGFGQGFSGFSSGGFDNDEMGDFFSQMFGFGGGRSKSSKGNAAGTRGQDIQIVLTISLEDAFTGIKNKIFKLNTFETCKDCSGKGGTGGQTTCGDCRGSGMKSSSHGFISFASTCSSCGGSGRNIANMCKKCHGEGRVQASKNIDISIPAGVDNNMTIKYRDFGEPGIRGGGNGDLLVTIQLKEHSIFQRKGDDLVLKQSVNLKQLICGDQIVIKGIDGDKITVIIPENSKPGDKLQIAKHGMIKSSSGLRGNLNVILDLNINKFTSGFQNDFKQIWDKYF